MPIALTTAYNPGDNDPNKTYPQAKIISYNIDIIYKSIHVLCQYGNTVDSVWVRGAGAPDKGFSIVGQAFLDIIAELPEEGETVYETVSRVLYEYLLDEDVEGHFVGTIV